jgi:SAM-dependent methyltransferase
MSTVPEAAALKSSPAVAHSTSATESPLATSPQAAAASPSEATDPSQQLPGYARQMEAFHRAFAAELRALVELLPLEPTARVVDVGCGDGFYVGLWAERLRTPGAVVGIDVNEPFLEQARRRTARVRPACELCFVRGDLFQSNDLGRDYDLVWSAQSLYSFPEPEATLRRMAELARPGGLVAVLENDTMHQLLLPWPSRVEMMLRAAERDALAAESPNSGKYYIGRRLPAVMAAAGIDPLGFKTQAIDRAAPLDAHLAEFLQSYLDQLFERVRPYLPEASVDILREYVSPDGETYLPKQPYFTMTWVNTLVWGRASCATGGASALKNKEQEPSQQSMP